MSNKSKYFNEVFKKLVNMSPKEFRKYINEHPNTTAVGGLDSTRSPINNKSTA